VTSVVAAMRLFRCPLRMILSWFTKNVKYLQKNSHWIRPFMCQIGY
jgi:hypothetical protein